MTHEERTQRMIVDVLKAYARPDVLWLHIPNGGKRSPKTGATLKAMGVRAGAADFLFVIDGSARFIEIKEGRGRASREQDEFMMAAERAGATYEVCHGYHAALEAISELGVFDDRMGIGVRNTGASAPVTFSPREPGVPASAG